MASAEKLSASQINIQGHLQFSVILTLRKQVEQLLNACSGDVEIDFSGVLSADSSALSFWLCCQRYAEQKGLSLTAANVPVQMQSFAGLVGLNNQLCN